MKITITIEVDDCSKSAGRLVAAVGPLTIEGTPETMPNQLATFTNVASPLSASFLLGPVELFSADGTTDEGLDTATVTFTSTDTTIASVAPAPAGSPANTVQINLVPGASGSPSITYTDPSGNKGQLDLTILPPVALPGVLVATVGSLVTS